MIFEKININYKKGILKQIRCFKKVILQYSKVINPENTFEKEIEITCPVKKVPTSDSKRTFYFKVNSKNYGYSLICIQQWVNLAEKMDADYYFICDDYELEKTILQNVVFSKTDIKFIKSDRKTYKPLLDSLCSKMFHNKSYAHLTAYTHAKEHNIKNYWDIDADDIYFFLDTNWLQKLISKAEEFMEGKNFLAITYDTDRSATYGLNWNFGITYVNVIDNLDEFLYSVSPEALKKYYVNYYGNMTPAPDLNGVFTYLKAIAPLGLGTFNSKNVYCMNWGMCNFKDFPRMLQFSYDDKKEIPIYKMLETEKDTKICPDIIDIEINIPRFYSKNIMKKMILGYSNYLDICKVRANNTQFYNLLIKKDVIPGKKTSSFSKVKKLFKKKNK